jgi:transcriptional adapter 2-alpha
MLDYPVLDAAWGADEELRLLTGIERFGLGNWADIAEWLGTKSLAEVETHYLYIYIESPVCPLPVRVPRMRIRARTVYLTTVHISART